MARRGISYFRTSKTCWTRIVTSTTRDRPVQLCRGSTVIQATDISGGIRSGALLTAYQPGIGSWEVGRSPHGHVTRWGSDMVVKTARHLAHLKVGTLGEATGMWSLLQVLLISAVLTEAALPLKNATARDGALGGGSPARHCG